MMAFACSGYLHVKMAVCWSFATLVVLQLRSRGAQLSGSHVLWCCGGGGVMRTVKCNAHMLFLFDSLSEVR